MYKALYRKWRPKTFDDVVGQDAITTILKNEIKCQKIAHAYLFTGSRGTGKTTCAKILASAVNCPNAHDGDPCLTCSVCKGIEDGSILDVVEIDAASNNGVDNIRELREEAVYSPAAASYRVYIIDEVHMLSQGAFNALLKIMEEPPAHVIFVLATTEVHKIPATIISRCQRFDFARIKADAVAKRLLYIAAEEGIGLSEGAAAMIARLCDGGMRDALSILDQCMSHAENVTEETVGKAVGLVGRDYLFDVIETVVHGDKGKMFAIIDDLHNRSIDFVRLCDELIWQMRNIMMIKANGDNTELIACMPDERDRLVEIAKSLELTDVIHYISRLQECLDRLGRAVNRRVEFEMTMLKISDRRLDASGEALLRRITALENGLPLAPVAATKPVKKVQETVTELKETAPPKSEKEPEPTALSSWGDIVADVGAINKALAGALVGSSAYIKGDYVLIDSSNAMLPSLLNHNDYAKQCLKESIRKFTGEQYKLGPYKRRQDDSASSVPSIDELEQRAKSVGINITVK